MKISLVIPAYNEEKHIAKCLDAVLRARTEALSEILLVDNGSTDRTAAIAGLFSGIRIIKEPQKGVTRARQSGLRQAHGDIVAFIDADTEVPTEWFKIIEREFSRAPQLVALSGPCRYTDLSIFQKRLVSWFFAASRLVYFFTGYLVLAGNLAARRRALLEAGGFNTNINFYGDDTDLAKRLHKLGRVKFTKDFYLYTSGRRITDHGILVSGLIYFLNFVWIVLWNRPLHKEYRDVR